MSARSIGIELEHLALEPGSVLRGRVRVPAPSGDSKRQVELSVQWETQGKGDTDRGVVLFEELAAAEQQELEHAFEVRLPLLPVSWAGTLLKVRWIVRVRCFAGGDETSEEREVHVGWPA
ncbi:MAG: hypothetical protein U0263_03385 [Polyangiaceae bacterium]